MECLQQNTYNLSILCNFWIKFVLLFFQVFFLFLLLFLSSAFQFDKHNKLELENYGVLCDFPYESLIVRTPTGIYVCVCI